MLPRMPLQPKRTFLPSDNTLPPWAMSLGLAVAVGLIYFLAARLSLALISRPDGVAVFWPAAGVASGVLIGLGPAARVPVILGTMAATILANILGDRNVWSALVFAACNAGEAVLVVFVGKKVLDALEPGPGGGGETIDEIELVPEHREIGAELRHMRLR